MGETKRISILALLIGIFVSILAGNEYSLIAIVARQMVGTEWAAAYIDGDNYWFGLVLIILSMLCAGFYTGRYTYWKGVRLGLLLYGNSIVNNGTK
ncbi:hypothetical protein PCCS19_00750 [Paenibacillus sp. CCS19]|uniref:hypothetical protein n=1 Tax=Paenibacillus sp. CCS19 TaxID=3158387 RepID=UPI002560820A|nr:hypothetical protein [Paenibacillus cellulosilyticus]GMK37022.1 hypothetical protein PCCS19_00750 [Paenibacillus cellulosilyticus]